MYHDSIKFLDIWLGITIVAQVVGCDAVCCAWPKVGAVLPERLVAKTKHEVLGAEELVKEQNGLGPVRSALEKHDQRDAESLDCSHDENLLESLL